MEGPTPTKKFQTRAGIQRKSKSDREQYAREEADRQQRRLAETTRNATAETRERGKPPGRGRGGASTHASDRIRSESISGVFGPAIPSQPTGKQRGGRQGSTLESKSEVVFSGPVGAQNNARNNAQSNKVLDEDPGAKGETLKVGDVLYISSDDDAGPKRDIENIWISSDDEEEEEEEEDKKPDTNKGKQRAGYTPKPNISLRPVRAPRNLPELDDLGTSQRRWKAAEVPKQKEGEDGGDDIVLEDDEMDVDDPAIDEIIPSVELRNKGRRRKPSRTKDVKLVMENLEERAERLRFNEDIRKLRQEFSTLPPDLASASPTILPDAASFDSTSDNPHSGRLFLFQFPPLTPYLIDATEKLNIKQEEPDGGGVAHSAPVAAVSKTVEPKKEFDMEETKPDLKEEIPEACTATSRHLPSGFVGKLNVHKSGKLTLDWGGTSMEVRYGSEVDFLQEAVLVGGDDERTTWALGQVQKKMIVIPDWQKLYD